MKTALITDTHANLAALESVLNGINALGCDRIICLGDMVGYAAEPNETLDKLRDALTIAVRGNHDIAALDPGQAEGFNTYAREAIFWSRGVLTTENQDYLRSLRDQEQIDDIIMAHGSLLDPDEYVFSSFQAAQSLQIAPCRITAIGHTHYPEVYRYSPSEERCEEVLTSEGEVVLEEGYRYLINAGSTGQPRDGDMRASFVIYDSKGSGRIEIHRVDYDIHATVEKIIKTGLPKLLADRLFEGR